MAVLKPFRGLLPNPTVAKDVAAVPYDVVNTQEAAALSAGNALSFLHVSRPEIDLPAGTDIHSDIVYETALKNFNTLREKAPLCLDQEEHVYVYRLTMNGRTQTGILACFSADEYFKGIIKKHEKTRADKEEDRARHVMTLRSQTGPVFLTYRDNENVNALTAKITAEKPLFDFVAPDGIRHELWRVSTAESTQLRTYFESVPAFYIADGHHRAAAGTRAARDCREHKPNYTGEEDFNYFMAVTFPQSELKILPYNRVVKDLNGMTADEFLDQLRISFTVEPCARREEVTASGEFDLYLGGKWYTVKPLFATDDLNAIEQLDVSLLQDYILAPMLNIIDPRTSTRVDFVGGIRGIGELERRVDSGECAAAFSMCATTLDQLFSVADANLIMPPKSTWFEPKLRDGLVCHCF